MRAPYCGHCKQDGHWGNECPTLDTIVTHAVTVTQPVTHNGAVVTQPVTAIANVTQPVTHTKHCPTCTCTTRVYHSNAEKQKAYRQRKGKIH